MVGRFDRRIHFGDMTRRVDQIADARRVRGARIIRGAVCDPNAAIGIADQVERKIELLVER